MRLPLVTISIIVCGFLASTIGWASAESATTTLFGSTVPPTKAADDSSSVTVGLKFQPKTSGKVTGIRFYKGRGNTGTHTGALFSSSGEKLASGTFSRETAGGWQTLTFSSAVSVSAGTTLTAAEFNPRGHYAVHENYSWPRTNGQLTGLAGVYTYGYRIAFPTSTYESSNYFVDVNFTPSASWGSPPSPTPTPSTTPSPSSSATPSPSPSATPGQFPTGSNTGVRAGTQLTAYTGPSNITTDGTVIDAKRITSCLVIRANNVTIKNSLLQSDGCFFNVLSDNGNTGLTLTDVEIDGLNNTTGDSAINGGGLTCLRCNIHGTVDGIKAQSNVLIQDSWIHDLAQGNDTHNDGIQSLGTTNLKILHNTIVIEDGSTSAIILSTGSATDMRNIQIDNNLLGGGAYTVYGGYAMGRDVQSRVSNIAITNNRFTTQIHPTSGAYGPLTSADPPVVVSGNTWHDGPKAGRPAS